MFFRNKASAGCTYFQLVQNGRQGAQVCQLVLATIGRVEDLRESGQLERLLRKCEGVHSL